MSDGTAQNAGLSPLVTRFGMPILIAYGVFVVATLVLKTISLGILGGVTMFQMSNPMTGGGGGVKLLLLLGYGSLAVPFLTRDKRGWLALALPLLAVGWAWWSIHELPMSALSLGFWLALASGAFLAFSGFQRSRT